MSFAELELKLESQRNAIDSYRQSSRKERIKLLQAIKSKLGEVAFENALLRAVQADFGKAPTETRVTELFQLRSHINHIKANLQAWMRTGHVDKSIQMIGLSAHMQYQSKGQVLVISPWNYPLLLSIYPILYALSAGCLVVLKPSEFTPNTNALIRTMFEAICPEKVIVVEGGVDEAQFLLKQPWGHIFFTGNPQVGKIVMGAAAKQLCSVTLELGGKTPCILHQSADIRAISQRLMWGKLVNGGQTCIAPDYVLVPNSKKELLIKACEQAITSLYGDRSQIPNNKDYCRIIRDKHMDHLIHLLDDAKQKGAKVRVGGGYDTVTRFFEPTILEDVTMDMEIMKVEIFGPILPVLTYHEEEAIFSIVSKNPNPLSLYIGSRDRKFNHSITSRIPSGSVLINDFLLVGAFAELPFGGIGNSGLGSSYGFNGFKAFSIAKPVLKRHFFPLKFIYPPYSKGLKHRMIEWYKKIIL